MDRVPKHVFLCNRNVTQVFDTESLFLQQFEYRQKTEEHS